MKVVFMGRKPAAASALAHLVDRGIRVAAVVAPIDEALEPGRPTLREAATALGLPVVSDAEVYDAIAGGDTTVRSAGLDDVDLVLSFLFPRRIERPLIELPRIGCFNFHPGPLPDFRGRRGYNFAILEGCAEYGASIHWVAEGFDSGDLVEVRTLPIAPDETAFSLEHRTVRLLLEMFRDFVDRALAGDVIPRTPQGPGRSATRKELFALARIGDGDAPELIERKVRAFWYPPYSGATIELGGRHYTLVDDAILAEIGALLHANRETR